LKSRRPKLVHVTTVPQTLAFLRGQVAYMTSHGFDVAAVSSPGPELLAFGRSEGIEVHPVAMPRRITPLGDLVALFRLVRLFRRIRPDVVHGHTPKGGLLGIIAARLAGVRARIYTLHGLPMETATGLRRTILRSCEQLSCGLARGVLAVSESLRRRALSYGLCPAEKIAVLGAGTVGGVDAERRFAPAPSCSYEAARVRRALGIPSEVRVVGFVGRVVRDKGVEDLVGAWAELREEFPDLYLLLVGPVEPLDPISPEAERVLRRDPRVRMAGPLDGMRAVYSTLDVVALPTYREGFPQVPLEAAAMERPVVASSVTGCVDAVVDGETGTLVPPRDPHALALALGAYLRDPALRRRHGRAARARVLRDYRPENLCLLTHWEYQRMLGRTATRGAKRPAGRRPLDALIKRTVDVAGALLGLAVLGPLILLITALLLATQGRPVFFRQRRPGRRGKIFGIVKFRTMRPGPEPDAVRTTWIGRLLRATSLDEIPQLWNVLVGDMSLVGPRPLLVQYLKLYSPRQARRHDVRPGMTGWVQINGRNGLDWEQKFELDVWYVDNGSLAVDLKILLKTILRVIDRAGIDGPGNASMPYFMGNTNAAATADVSPERPARRTRDRDTRVA
jgi:lipopolysaccharide/colanic/teichoic acid biosynthesis glycosyltransferase/glycosyltransferase involved in cell wall biosynthesis